MDLNGITEETLEAVKKAQTSGALNNTGLFGYDLSQWVSLIPVETPFRNRTPRVGSENGAKFATWRALLDVSASQPDIAIGWDNSGSLAILSEQDVQAPYAPYALAGRVTQDAIDLGKGYADARAIAAINTLNMLMIAEDIKLIGAQSFTLQTPGTPAVSVSATTGGTIAASTAVNVKVAARTSNNYYYGGSTVASAQGTVTTGTTTSTNTALATVAAVPGAVAYDWFVGGVYYTTTTVNKVTITSVPTAAQALPSTLPLLSTVAPTVPPTADSSANAKDTNGLLATLVGDYSTNGTIVTRGTGTSSGATFTSLDGGTLTVSGSSIVELDAFLLAIWNKVLLSPSVLMMNAQEATNIANKVLGTNAAVTYLTPDNAAQRHDVVAGGFVGTYINKAAGGKAVSIEVHPHLPPGTIIARTDVVPFPGSNITNVTQVRTLRDYADFSYGANWSQGGLGPREDFEIRTVEAFQNKAPVTMGVLSNIANG